MLQGTIRNDDFWGNTAFQCQNNVVSVRNNVATMLERFVALKIVVIATRAGVGGGGYVRIVSCNIAFMQV